MKKKLNFLISSFLLLTLFQLPTTAEITYSGEQTTKVDNPNVVIRSTTNQDNANAISLLSSLSFSDNVDSWYVVYPDVTSANSDGYNAGDVASVIYQGVTFDEVSVFIANTFDGAGGIDQIIAENTTIFFAPGFYSVSAGNGNYGRIYKKNLSLIGLDTSLHSGSVRFDFGEMSGGHPRTLIQSDFYSANITFDAMNRDMKSGSYGDYYIHIPAGLGEPNNIVFDNVIIQNVGKSSGFYGRKNVAINIVNAKDVMFNNVKLLNTSTYIGYAPIQVNNGASQIYFNNFEVDTTNWNAFASNSPFIKIESGATYPDALPNTSAFFTGELTFKNMTDGQKQVYIESYQYNTLAFPSDQYRYAQLKTMNGSATTGYILLSQSMPTLNQNYALFDLKDHSFVILDQGSGTMESQMETLYHTIGYLHFIKGITTQEEYNVKFEVTNSFATFDIPEVTTISNYLANLENTTFNMIPVTNRDNSIMDVEIIKYKNDYDISFPVDTADRFVLYNFDFDTETSLTLHEVTKGINAISPTDPYDREYLNSSAAYESYTTTKGSVIANSTADSFANSTFTSLVNEIVIVRVSAQEEINVGDTIDLDVGLSNNISNSYTDARILNDELNKDTVNDVGISVEWLSMNPSIASIDQNGVVTTLSEGEAIIVAKALDSFNEGEIEKPWAVYLIEVGKSVSGGGGGKDNFWLVPNTADKSIGIILFR
ncbi:MAG: hypothetical protein ACK5LZ_01500 [Anaerorhabdus sp.]